jgi:hypothetical protein
MGRVLRTVGLVILVAIAFSFLATYNKQPAKPIPMPLPMADETNPEAPRTVRVIQIYKPQSDQLTVDTLDPPTSAPAAPISAFPETATVSLLDTLPSSAPIPPAPAPAPPPPPQKTAADFCEQFHMHKVFANNGKSWRCVK